MLLAVKFPWTFKRVDKSSTVNFQYRWTRPDSIIHSTQIIAEDYRTRYCIYEYPARGIKLRNYDCTTYCSPSVYTSHDNSFYQSLSDYPFWAFENDRKTSFVYFTSYLRSKKSTFLIKQKGNAALEFFWIASSTNSLSLIIFPNSRLHRYICMAISTS